MSAPGSPAGSSPKMSGRQMTLPARPAGSPQPSTHARTPSGASAASGAAPGQARSNFPPPLGYDPGKMDTRPPLSHEERVGKRVDLPADAYLKTDISSTFATRSGFNTEGTPTRLSVNQYPVTRIANMDVFQYDVALSPEPTGGVVYDKVWKSKAVQQKLASVTKKPWIYDGRKLAWLAQSVDEMRLLVDLDEERGRKPGGERKNAFHITIRPTGKVRLQSLRAYLMKTAPWDNHVLECMSFLDHLLRQGPSERMKTIKRSFFHPSMPGRDLDMLLMACKGVYASFRLSENVKQIGLGVNVDVSNQTFWKANPADKMIKYVINNYGGLSRNQLQNLDDQMITSVLKPLVSQGRYEQSEAMRALRRLKGCRFTLLHRPNETKEYKIKGFAFDKKHGPNGANSYNVKFNWKQQNGTEKEICIKDYMKERYGYLVRQAGWPVIETTRAGSFPAEVCNIVGFNQYQYKLDPQQTASMIKFAVQRPDQRKKDISASVQRLDWANDKYLKAFGVSISPEMAKTEAKVLRHPEVFFEKKTARPLNTGRWDLRGARFIEANKEPLTHWGFIGLNMCVDVRAVNNFVQQFTNIYKGHGGRIAKNPYTTNINANPATLADELHKHVPQIVGGRTDLCPQIVFVAVPDKSAHVYERLKKIFECRYGIVTQVLQADHVKKAQGQYISNVCMKVNAKLGGQTSSLTATKAKSHNFFIRPTMMIGVDVTHASPGSDMPSIAAMCASVDVEGYQYRAAVQTNGWHNEILTDENISTWIPTFLKAYKEKTGREVEDIYYFRDGVSEGQFAHVMEQEVKAIKKAFRERNKKDAKMTVIVATKRHHIRFFPDRGDKNGNPEPGTLVEREVTHPFHYDFFLSSHFALQGTARPVHYHVLMDEIKPKVNNLQRMIYQQCYTFCRATTPISLHPAVYYAHLAGARARCHENRDYGNNTRVPEKVRDQVNNPNNLVAKHQDPTTYSSDWKKNNPPPRLIPMQPRIHNTMWWV
ncbi:Piwi-domain-containing protein [Neurospora crassa]|uniref:Meiotic silencing suppressor 2 n=2 Tax=Neurospora crassa TaxID=5141 RepID=Q1K660_NEUCR|nr:meiotic silencing suppressor 2 [Neurospora crassa OR74A]AAN32951.1 suppressor of meiotic silencing [Neurospora crassa]EAA29350.1 meiotic silencing suppressor 2 [Neurospora crassa OR74A]KHE87238.1 Piwi-domain-containing protein [Neurospora crassa]|eukprot:XP_958586.1 meiotic silencing suppressor 2 [Neurospora crassa OR74A]